MSNYDKYLLSAIVPMKLVWKDEEECESYWIWRDRIFFKKGC